MTPGSGRSLTERNGSPFRIVCKIPGTEEPGGLVQAHKRVGHDPVIKEPLREGGRERGREGTRRGCSRVWQSLAMLYFFTVAFIP